MVVRQRKRKNKLRGNRTQHGNKKNWRGAGTGGGRGKAGNWKHKRMSFYKIRPEKNRLKPKKETGKPINLWQLEEMLPILLGQKKVERRGSEILVDGSKIGFDKLLGEGKASQRLVIVRMDVSKKAAKKIEEAGGRIEEAQGHSAKTENESGDKNAGEGEE